MAGLLFPAAHGPGARLAISLRFLRTPTKA